MSQEPDTHFFDDLDEVDALIGEGRRARVLDRLLGILRKMVSTRDFDALLTYVMDQVIELTGAERGFLMLPDPQGALKVRVAHNLLRQDIEKPEFQISHTVIDNVLKQQRLVRIDDATSDRELGNAPSVVELHLRSIMVAPLRSPEGGVHGVVYVDHRSAAERFAPEHEEVLELFTEQAASVIENARLSDELRRREKEIRALNSQLEELVTERTEELRRTQELHSQVVEQTSVSVNTFELDGRVSTWNAASEQLFGVSAAEAIGKKEIWSSLRPVGTDAGPESFVSRTVAEGSVKGEYAVARPDGSTKRLLMESNLLHAPGGEPAGVVAVAIDVTELRRVERMLVRRNDLTDLGMVAAGVAHDFNNLLAVILGRAQVAQVASREPGIQGDLGIIEKAAKDGTEAVDRIRSFIERRTDPIQTSLVVADLIADVVAMTRTRWKIDAAAAGRTYNVITSVEPEVPEIRGNISQLRQALINLVLNALDAMPAGGDLEIDARVSAATVQIDVRDSGTGIPPDALEHIFEPFFSTKGEQGTGLGLSTSSGIIRGHGGTLEVESEMGRGTVFRIVLPALARPEGEAPAPVESARRLGALVIDDDPAMRAVLVRMLQLHGCEVAQVDSGKDALAHFEPGAHRVVFVALERTGKSTSALVAEVKSRSPDTVVVLTAGWSREEPRELPEHADLLLTKPFKIPDVRVLLERIEESA